MIEHEQYSEEEVKRSCEINYRCKGCPATFATDFAIKSHIRIHHPCIAAEETIE